MTSSLHLWSEAVTALLSISSHNTKTAIVKCNLSSLWNNDSSIPWLQYLLRTSAYKTNISTYLQVLVNNLKLNSSTNIINTKLIITLNLRKLFFISELVKGIEMKCVNACFFLLKNAICSILFLADNTLLLSAPVTTERISGL